MGIEFQAFAIIASIRSVLFFKPFQTYMTRNRIFVEKLAAFKFEDF